MFTYEKARKFAKKLSSVYSIMGDNLTVANQYATAILKLYDPPAPGKYYSSTCERMGDVTEELNDNRNARRYCTNDEQTISVLDLYNAVKFCEPAADKIGKDQWREEFTKVIFNGKNAYATNGTFLHTYTYGRTAGGSFGFRASELKSFVNLFPLPLEGECRLCHRGGDDAIECADGSVFISRMEPSKALSYDKIIPKDFTWQAKFKSAGYLELIKRYSSPAKEDRITKYKGTPYTAQFAHNNWHEVLFSVERHDIKPECTAPFKGYIEKDGISPGYSGCDKVTLDADNLFKSLSAFQKDDVIELSVVGNKSPVVLSCEQKLALIMPVC